MPYKNITNTSRSQFVRQSAKDIEGEHRIICWAPFHLGSHSSNPLFIIYGPLHKQFLESVGLRRKQYHFFLNVHFFFLAMQFNYTAKSEVEIPWLILNLNTSENLLFAILHNTVFTCSTGQQRDIVIYLPCYSKIVTNASYLVIWLI